MNYKIFLISRRSQGAGIRCQGLAPEPPKGDKPEKCELYGQNEN